MNLSACPNFWTISGKRKQHFRQFTIFGMGTTYVGVFVMTVSTSAFKVATSTSALRVAISISGFLVVAKRFHKCQKKEAIAGLR